MAEQITPYENVDTTNLNVTGTLTAPTNFAFQGVTAAYTTTSTAMVFTGSGVIITPKMSGSVKISLASMCNNNTLAAGVNINLVYAAGTALTAAGTATAGTALLSSPLAAVAAVAGVNTFLGISNFILTGLTLGTSYTIQPTISATADTASYSQFNITVEEMT